MMIRRLVGGRVGSVFGANLLIAGSIALLVYFLEQTALLERLLNLLLRGLFLLALTLFRYQHVRLVSLPGMAVDLLAVVIAALVWSRFRTFAGRVLANGLLFAALVPLTVFLFARFGVFISAAPIVLGIIVASSVDAGIDLTRRRLRYRIVEEKQEAEFSVIRHLAHNVKPNLQIARSPLVSLRELLSGRGLLAEPLSRRLDGSWESVGEALDNALCGLGQINDIIDSTRRVVTREIRREEFREEELKGLLEREIFPRHAGRLRLAVTGPPVRLPLHRESFVEAINNLIRNAEIHGFPEPRPDAELRFALRATRKRVVIDYSNNGRPFPDNLTARDFLSFGRKGADSPGEGLGGAWIGRVVEAHGGTFEIIRDGQPVHFRITLPRQGG